MEVGRTTVVDHVNRRTGTEHIAERDGGKRVLPKRDELLAVIPLEQQDEDLKELLEALRARTGEVMKLSEEEIKLRNELNRLKTGAGDPATHLAKEVLEVDWQLRFLKSRVRGLRDQLEKTKKP